MSAHTGEVTVDIGDQKYTLKYDWAAISEINENLGVDVLKSIFSASPKEIAKIVAIGLGGKISEEDLFKASPPIIPLLESVSMAINYAYFGADKPKTEDKPSKKKTLASK